MAKLKKARMRNTTVLDHLPEISQRRTGEIGAGRRGESAVVAMFSSVWFSRSVDFSGSDYRPLTITGDLPLLKLKLILRKKSESRNVRYSWDCGNSCLTIPIYSSWQRTADLRRN